MAKHVDRIAAIMEMMGDPSSVSSMPGLQGTTEVSMDIMPGDQNTCDLGEEACEGFTAEQLAAAKNLVSMVGSADKARELIDKVDEVMEILQPNADQADTDAIDMIAGLLPAAADMPTLMATPMNMGNRFSPSA